MAYNRGRQQNDGPELLFTTKFQRQLRSLIRKTTNQYTGREEGEMIDRDVVVEEGVEEALTISFSAERIQEFIERLQAAADDQEGTGGVTMRFYSKRKEANGRVFNGTHVTIWPTKPYTERGGGRKSYANSGTSGGGRTNRGGQTRGSQRGGSGQNAQRNASPFNPLPGIDEAQNAMNDFDDSGYGADTQEEIPF